MPDGDSGPEGWKAWGQFAAVMDIAPLKENETLEYWRRKGIYPNQPEQWCKACENANEGNRQANIKLKSERKTNRKRTKELEKELTRKKRPLLRPRPFWCCQKNADFLGIPWTNG